MASFTFTKTSTAQCAQHKVAPPPGESTTAFLHKTIYSHNISCTCVTKFIKTELTDMPMYIGKTASRYHENWFNSPTESTSPGNRRRSSAMLVPESGVLEMCGRQMHWSRFTGPSSRVGLPTDSAVVEPCHERQLMFVAAVVGVQLCRINRHVERAVPAPSHLSLNLAR